MRGIRLLRIFSQAFAGLTLPPLTRPYDTPRTPKTKAIVQWGICIYAYSVVSHFGRLVRGLITLAEDGNAAATAPIARHIFEWTAATSYLTEELRTHFENQNWQAAWDVLGRFTLGSGWIKKWGGMYVDFDIEPNRGVPVPPKPGELVASYQRYFDAEHYGKSALEKYSYLCDHSHTTSIVLTRYRHNPISPEVTAFQLNPDEELFMSFLPSADMSLIDAFKMFLTLLGLADERHLRQAILATLHEIIARKKEVESNA